MPNGVSGSWKPVESEVPCRKCSAVGHIELSIWESCCGGYEDAHYRCKACGNDWWIDGADA